MTTASAPGGAPSGRPLIFGEVLFDRFEDGSAVLGGAPFNVAWHLQGFGLAPLFLSRIGTDALGERVLAAMESWGMDRGGLQRDDTHPTGTVEVRIEEGQPSFDICPDQAYDHIDPAALGAALEGADGGLLYHGTLAARAGSARALDALRAPGRGLPAFVDVNLRAPWWDREGARTRLRGARWVKLNDDELALLAGVPRGTLDNAGAVAAAGRPEREALGVEVLVITRGDAGAVVLAPGVEHSAPAAPVTGLVDTVGAGDAFSAVTLLGLVRGWPLPAILERALQFASAICAQRGATAPDRELYRRHLENWNG